MVRFGESARTLLAAARDLDVDLIALASRGVGGLRRLWTRSVARKVLADAPNGATRDEHADNVIVRLRPERWLTVDFSKAGGSS